MNAYAARWFSNLDERFNYAGTVAAFIWNILTANI
jgi:hypothetical protein